MPSSRSPHRLDVLTEFQLVKLRKDHVYLYEKSGEAFFIGTIAEIDEVLAHKRERTANENHD